MSAFGENPLSHHLFAALETDDPDERDYHVNAAQLFHAKIEGVGRDE